MRALSSPPSPVATIPAEPEGEAQPARAPWLKLLPDDGWLTIVLLAVLVFATVLSIQSVTPPWAPGLQILAATSGMGMLLGYLAVQQGRLPAFLIHTAALLLGGFFAFDQTASAVLSGDRIALLRRVLIWFRSAAEVIGSSDNTVFLLFLAILTFLLAYISFWLVLRTRRPWLAVLANGTVLLINLNWGSDNLLIFLVVFLLVSLLLLVRFTLAENMRRWRRRGLRFSPDLTWDFMLAGTVFSVVVLLLAYVLPVGVGNAQVLGYINDPNGTWQRVQERFGLVFGGVAGPKGGGSGAGLFNGNVVLRGNVDLPEYQIFHYTVESGGDAGQYLVAQTYDHYDGISVWSPAQVKPVNFDSDQQQPASGRDVKTTTYTIGFDQIPAGGQRQLLVPGSEPASFNLPTTTYISSSSDVPMSWDTRQPLRAGENYHAQGYVSTATANDLRAVPRPAQVIGATPTAQYYYPLALLNQYLPPGAPISPEIRQAALNATRNSSNMYDAAVDIEAYLRTFTYSQHNPEPPSNVDHTVWFLQQKQGYCTFFASAMALMGRSLGMPTRLVSGFTNGTYDTKTGMYIVKGTASHTWTQIYFARYGWVNFEPTQSFSTFNRPVSSTGGTATPVSTTTGGGATPTPAGDKDKLIDPTIGSTGPNGSPLMTTLFVVLSTLLVLLLLAGGGLLWWRALFRGLAPAVAMFGRVTRLGAWAGAPPERSQTPREYAERLGTIVPEQRGAIQRLSAAYARERYGGGASGEVAKDLPRLYDAVRAALARLISRQILRAPLALLRRGPRRPATQPENGASEADRVRVSEVRRRR